MISSKDISVVIQGPIDHNEFKDVISSIRRNLPSSEIIISTWKNQKLTDNQYDNIIFNDDPGGFKDKISQKFTNNLLRHIKSSLSGLYLCKSKYVLRMRSDLILMSDNFLNFYSKFKLRNDNYKIFSKQIITSSFFSKKFLYYKGLIQPTPFHISDWIHFGLTDDIIKLYSASIPNEPIQSQYFDTTFQNINKTNLFHCSHQYAPEQFLLSNLVYNLYNIKFEHYLDYNRYIIEKSEEIIANNFIILSPYHFKFYCTKKKNGTDYYRLWSKYPFLLPKNIKRGLYSYKVFLDDYNKYVVFRKRL